MKAASNLLGYELILRPVLASWLVIGKHLMSSRKFDSFIETVTYYKNVIKSSIASTILKFKRFKDTTKQSALVAAKWCYETGTKAIKSAKATIHSVIEAVKTKSIAAWHSTIKFIKDLPANIDYIVDWTLNRVYEGIRRGWQVTIKTLRYLQSQIIKGFNATIAFIKSLPHRCYQFMINTIRNIKNTAIRFKKLIKGYVKWLWQEICNTPKYLKSLIKALYRKMVNIIQRIKLAIEYSRRRMLAFFHRTFKFIKSIPSRLIKLFYDFVNFISKTVNALLKFAKEVYSEILAFLRAIPGFIKGLAIELKESFLEMLQELKTMAIDAWTFIKNIPSLIKQAIQQTITFAYDISIAIFNGFKQALIDVKNLVIDAYRFILEIPGFIKSCVLAGRDMLIDFANNVKEFSLYLWAGIKQIPSLLTKVANELISMTVSAFKSICLFANYVMEKTLSKLLIGIGSWFGVSLALVDFMADGVNWALINTIGTTIATTAAFEPTKMAVAGLLSLTSAFFAIRYIYLGVAAFAGLIIISKDAPETGEEVHGDIKHNTSMRYTENKSAQMTLSYDARLKEAPSDNMIKSTEETSAPRKANRAA